MRRATAGQIPLSCLRDSTSIEVENIRVKSRFQYSISSTLCVVATCPLRGKSGRLRFSRNTRQSTRGVYLWWKSPTWLRLSNSEWPSPSTTSSYDTAIERNHRVMSHITQPLERWELESRYSS